MRKFIYSIDTLFNALFSSKLNPIYHSGTITILSLLIAALSGLYLLIFYRTGTDASFDSMNRLSQQPFQLGILIRGFHRYSSDLAIVSVLVHALRLIALDRFRGHRWIAWVSGVFWLTIIWVVGVTGYWLVWDQRGQMVATSIIKAITSVVRLGEPLARSLLHNALVKDQLFFILLFLHIFLSIFMAAMWWLHTSRISRPKLLPPLWIGLFLFISLAAVSLAKPAINAPRADLYVIPGSVPLDLFYLFFVPFTVWPGWALAVSGGISLFFFLYYRGL